MNLRDLKVLIRSKLTCYLKDLGQPYRDKNLNSESIAEELIYQYPNEFSSYKKKNFKKFHTLVRINLEEIELNKDLNESKKKQTFHKSESEDSLSDYTMPESSHNLNDWLTTRYQNTPSGKDDKIPASNDDMALSLKDDSFYSIDKVGEKKSKRFSTSTSSKPVKKLKSDDKISEISKSNKKNEINKTDKSKPTFQVIHPTCDFTDLIGLDDIITKIKSYLRLYSLGENKLMRSGYLLSGAVGSGKTTLAKCISHHLHLPLIIAPSCQLLNGLPSEKAEQIDKLFNEAVSNEPCFVLIEKIELFTDHTRDQNSNSFLTEKLIQKMEDVNENGNDIWIIATTSKVESVDPQLFKGHRFQKTFHLPLPNLSKRVLLLEKYLKSYLTPDVCDVFWNDTNNEKLSQPPNHLEEDIILPHIKNLTTPAKVTLSPLCTTQLIAEKTPSFSAPDLKTLIDEAIIFCLNKLHSTSQHSLEPIDVMLSLEDFERALSVVKASTMSEDVVSVPEVTWEDIGALGGIREDLSWLILKHIRHPEVFERDRLPLRGGVMLYGPPGCGKTLIAKAIANEASLNFISVAGPELKDKYVGESEKNIRMLFRRAQECAPCLIFFDEIDSICSTRGFGSESSNGVNVVQQMLTELDGVKERKGVYVMGATNRLDQVDPAFLRENRFGTKFFIGLPTAEGRYEILHSLTKGGKSPLLADDVDLRKVAQDPRCHNLNGADLLYLVREATLVKLKSQQNLDHHHAIQIRHFEEVLQKIKPSVSPQQLKLYQNMAATH